MRNFLQNLRNASSLAISTNVLMVSAAIIVITSLVDDMPVAGRVFLSLAGLFVIFTLIAKVAVDVKMEKTNVEATAMPVSRTQIHEGWYPTPDDEQERYHDGTRWTEEFRPRESAKNA